MTIRFVTGSEEVDYSVFLSIIASGLFICVRVAVFRLCVCKVCVLVLVSRGDCWDDILLWGSSY